MEDISANYRIDFGYPHITVKAPLFMNVPYNIFWTEYERATSAQLLIVILEEHSC